MPTPSTRLAAAALLAAAAATQAAPISGQGTWETTLRARDIAGNAVALDSASAAFFYDTTLNITWQANMNANGPVDWSTALAWAEGLTTGGFDDWRLPIVIDSGTAGCDFSYAGTDCGYNVQTQIGGAYSEWAHLFYVTLGNLGSHDTSGNRRRGGAGVDYGLANTAYFQDMKASIYWSGTEYLSPGSGAVWYFETRAGYQDYTARTNPIFAAAVRSGDVLRETGTVPEPQSLALALTALAGLGLGLRRRRGTPRDRTALHAQDPA